MKRNLYISAHGIREFDSEEQLEEVRAKSKARRPKLQRVQTPTGFERDLTRLANAYVAGEIDDIDYELELQRLPMPGAAVG